MRCALLFTTSTTAQLLNGTHTHTHKLGLYFSRNVPRENYSLTSCKPDLTQANSRPGPSPVLCLLPLPVPSSQLLFPCTRPSQGTHTCRTLLATWPCSSTILCLVSSLSPPSSQPKDLTLPLDATLVVDAPRMLLTIVYEHTFLWVNGRLTYGTINVIFYCILPDNIIK